MEIVFVLFAIMATFTILFMVGAAKQRQYQLEGKVRIIYHYNSNRYGFYLREKNEEEIIIDAFSAWPKEEGYPEEKVFDNYRVYCYDEEVIFVEEIGEKDNAKH